MNYLHSLIDVSGVMENFVKKTFACGAQANLKTCKIFSLERSLATVRMVSVQRAHQCTCTIQVMIHVTTNTTYQQDQVHV